MMHQRTQSRAMRKRFCLRGHDTEAVGRTLSRNCRECVRAWDRERNARRRLDPAWRAAEARYKTDWWTFRGYSLSLCRRMERDKGLLRDLLADEFGLVYKPRSRAEWNGDPHDLHAPLYRYRTRRGGWLQPQRLTKEAVEEVARTHPWVAMQRERMGD